MQAIPSSPRVTFIEECPIQILITDTNIQTNNYQENEDTVQFNSPLHIHKQFSWNAIDDDAPTENESLYKKKSCSKRLSNAFKQSPILLRYIAYVLSGCIILYIPGLISYFLFVQDKSVSFSN